MVGEKRRFESFCRFADTYGRPSAISLFIRRSEVNKRLYMDEETLEKTDGFDRLRNDIQSVYGLLHKESALNSVRCK